MGRLIKIHINFYDTVPLMANVLEMAVDSTRRISKNSNNSAKSSPNRTYFNPLVSAPGGFD